MKREDEDTLRFAAAVQYLFLASLNFWVLLYLLSLAALSFLSSVRLSGVSGKSLPFWGRFFEVEAPTRLACYSLGSIPTDCKLFGKKFSQLILTTKPKLKFQIFFRLVIKLAFGLKQAI